MVGGNDGRPFAGRDRYGSFDRHVLHAHNPLIRLEFRDPIHQQEGIAVRKNAFDCRIVQRKLQIHRGRSQYTSPLGGPVCVSSSSLAVRWWPRAASAQTKRPATFDDVLNIKAIQGATISPDGKWVIYGVRQWVAEQDKMEARTHVWKVATDGSSPARQITFGEKGDSQAQFSPDGKFISFISARGNAEAKAQIYVMSARRRRGVEADRREGKRQRVFVGAGRLADRVCRDRCAQRRRGSQHQEAR